MQQDWQIETRQIPYFTFFILSLYPDFRRHFMRFRVLRSSQVCVVDKVSRNIGLDRKEYDRYYKANFGVLVSILRVLFYSIRQKIGACSHCNVLWHISSQERGRHKSDPGNGKVQRKLEESDLRSPRSSSSKDHES